MLQAHLYSFTLKIRYILVPSSGYYDAMVIAGPGGSLFVSNTADLNKKSDIPQYHLCHTIQHV